MPHRRHEGKRLQSGSGLRDQLARRSGLQASTVVAEHGRPQLLPESARGPYPSQDSKRVPFQFDHPQELVWRRRLLSPTVMTENEPEQEPPRLFHTPQLRSMPSQETVPAVPPAAERSAALQITNLDPGLLDRLTDDVIHRVERRMRIERQRRGI